jgi:rhamnogalacturonyl hydrolase YesR
MGFAKNHGPLQYYYMTGDERALDAGKLTGDYCIYWSGDPKNIIGNEERVAGYGLMCLVQAYKATGDKKYLSAARKLVETLINWQDKKTGAWFVKPEIAGDPRPKSDTNGCVFMLGGLFEALIDYYEMTKEEDVKTMIIKGVDYMITTLWKDGPEKYSINLLVVHAPAWCYVQTKDKRFIDAARNAYDIATRNNNAEWAGGKMLAQHWRAASRFLYIIENDPELMKLGGY